ncbi:2-amino-4-hydroxy-6-hydroxymethyldihydropteridine diphosphokinase [Acaryochloris sp. IP29b_bin.148]|uniref:2-amino-4-hydroxy-6- hydroxymethyldihydropteridine diphosphokinase n=1 Tax=Acaryochloris sp. IP29b_bin.148 TaxID=2969218 RepID=UPI0026034169|nr:2-amino-4-hydroxy-6-hydroxymethyldihydropteridine diphosphokinase [Acaryochloris sp. IP29b_bin.148]
MVPTDPKSEHPVAIALGSNLGDSRAILVATIDQLSQDPKITVQAQSHWFQTAAVGPPQPDYLNGCVSLLTTYSPQPLLEKLLQIEAQFGRVRRQRWGPRTLDLDLLLYGDRVIQTPTLTVPHPFLHERAFVLAPLAEICPGWVHPVQEQTIAELAKAVDYTGVQQLSD